MTVDIPCPRCARPLRVTEAHRGRSALCPGCQTTFVIPTDEAPPFEAMTAAPAPEAQVEEEDEAEPVPRRLRQRTIKFGAWVEKDSGGLLWRWGTTAQVTEDGLFVGKGEKGFYAEPRHCTAEHLGGNRVRVEMGGREVVFKVSKNAAYNARLARALVDHLNRGMAPLEPAEYRIEWYLFALCFLPLGIALIGVGVSDSPFVAGLCGGAGGGLFGVCSSLAAMEKVPLVLRVVLILGIAVGGYFALYALHPRL